MDNKIATGVIRTSFGLKGFLKVRIYSDSFEHLKKLKEVTLKKKNSTLIVVIEKIEVKGKDLLVKFEGCDSPEKAKSFNGYEIFINREDANPLKPGECYLSDLINLKVMYQGKEVGSIISVVDNEPRLLLEIKTEEDIYLIPYEKRFFENRDLEKGCIDIKEIQLIS